MHGHRQGEWVLNLFAFITVTYRILGRTQVFTTRRVLRFEMRIFSATVSRPLLKRLIMPTTKRRKRVTLLGP